MRTAIALLIGAACSNKPAPVKESPPLAAPVTPARADRNTIELPGDANGLYWHDGEHALYFTDDTHDDLVRWTDRKGVTEIARLPPAAKVSYGGLVRTGDGSFVIAVFGFGTDGGVIVVDPDHVARAVPNLDKARRRVGIARGADNALYDVYFVVDGHSHHGGLAKLDPATGETDIAMPGLVKPVGVAADARGVYVSDQEANGIVAWRAGAAAPIASGLPSADLMALLPDGSLVTGGKTGTVSRIAQDGKVTTVVQGLDQVRGLAYDATGKRLFMVEHSKATSNHKLRIVALP